MNRLSCAGASVLVALVTAGCVTATSPLSAGKIDESYTVGGGQWVEGGTIYVIAKTFEHQGNVAVCGAWTRQTSTARTTNYDYDVIQTGVLQIDGSYILQGFDRFPEISYARDITGSRADCLITDRAWDPAYDGVEPSIRFARQVYDRDFEDQGDEGITFRQATVQRIIAGG